MKKIPLPSNWMLNGAKIGTCPATVPGCVHTDLRAAGYLSDLYWRDQNKKAQWIENEDWEYTCRFNAEIGNRVSLVFEGLDTYATIRLNGQILGHTDDMFLTYSYNVTDLLVKEDNELCVQFTSPIRAVEDQPLCEGAFTKERMRTRRMQCTYGWDWVDRFVTSGIYRPVYLRYENDMYVEDLYLYTVSVDRFGAQLVCEVSFQNEHLGSLVSLEILDPTEKVVARKEIYVSEKTLNTRFDLENPELWYPNGYGEQPLYTLRVHSGENIYTHEFGIRTLKIVQLPDKKGSEYALRAKRIQSGEAVSIFDKNTTYSGFQIVVNGIPIFSQGANWVPCEPFPSAVLPEKVKMLIKKAKKAGLNTLRVWGGGIFECEAFYSACDREGILVIQDFLMACGSYPEKEPWFLERLQNEAEQTIKKLRNHPCLAFWQGDNENATLGSDSMKDFKGRNAALKALQPIVSTLDHQRSFMISSPCGGELYASLTCGTSHITNYLTTTFDYFNQTDCYDYQAFLSGYTARFINEEPIFGAAEIASLRRFLTDADIFLDNSEEMLRYHSKSNPCLAEDMYDTMKRFAFKLLGEAKDDVERQFKYRYMQYEWMRVVFENARRNLGYCNGMIFWMYDDCWPAALGWSIVDYYGIPKAGYYCFSRMSKPLVGSVTEECGQFVLHVSNTADRPLSYTVTSYHLSGTDGYAVKELCKQNGIVNAYGVQKNLLPWVPDADSLIICDVAWENDVDRSFYKQGTLPLHLTKEFDILEKTATSMTLRAKHYLHAVHVESDGTLSDNYFSMLSGEVKTIVTETDATIGTVSAYTL